MTADRIAHIQKVARREPDIRLALSGLLKRNGGKTLEQIVADDPEQFDAWYDGAMQLVDEMPVQRLGDRA